MSPGDEKILAAIIAVAIVRWLASRPGGLTERGSDQPGADPGQDMAAWLAEYPPGRVTLGDRFVAATNRFGRWLDARAARRAR